MQIHLGNIPEQHLENISSTARANETKSGQHECQPGMQIYDITMRGNNDLQNEITRHKSKFQDV